MFCLECHYRVTVYRFSRIACRRVNCIYCCGACRAIPRIPHACARPALLPRNAGDDYRLSLEVADRRRKSAPAPRPTVANCCVAAHQRCGLGGPELGAAAAPPSFGGERLFHFGVMLRCMVMLNGGPCGEGATLAGPNPVRQPCTVCHPFLAGEVAGSPPVC